MENLIDVLTLIAGGLSGIALVILLLGCLVEIVSDYSKKRKSFKNLQKSFKALCKYKVFDNNAVDFALYLIDEGVELKKVFKYTQKAYPTFKDVVGKEFAKKLKHINKREL